MDDIEHNSEKSGYDNVIENEDVFKQIILSEKNMKKGKIKELKY
jgi:hypothetical protein